MAQQLGRISGPVLSDNLLRNGTNLDFRNQSNSTPLLKLDVVNGRIAVNNSTSSRDLFINGTTRSVDIIAIAQSTVGANLQFLNSEINSLSGSINIESQEKIIVSTLATQDILINDNKISTQNTNSELNFIPAGTGTIELQADTNISGNLHATGNITADGNIIIGDSDTDNVVFNADLGNSIIPATSNTYSIGSADKRWEEIYSNLLNGQGIIASEIIASGGWNFPLKQGNIFFVSINGDDSNGGDNVQNPFRTLKAALGAADASTTGPVTIQIFAGEYEEVFPLTVPSNVTVQGVDMRNTIIKPTVGTNTNTAFLLNGETTVQNLTIKDFYAPGYAFEFASNTIVSTRSPYVQNVTVITKGSVISASDPRGFDQADAGSGAYIDGANVNSVSNEASMLFHSCTFITPGVDAVTMTNGVRVEWLNSFTYFANRGLYAVDGVTGHLSTDGSTVKYGAEIRSIGSANVYGNYGVVADGADTLMYLIQHNFSYIGCAADTSNDNTLTIPLNETVELNNGRIVFTKIDQQGNYSVGTSLIVNQETGNILIDATISDFTLVDALTITTGANSTVISNTQIDTGFINISNNTITSISDALNIDTPEFINFNNDTNIQGNLDLSGSITIGGTLITIGNQTSDVVSIDAEINTDLLPSQDSNANIGSVSKRWKTLYADHIYVDNEIEIYDNIITTTVSNADLELAAAGTSVVVNQITVSNQFLQNSGVSNTIVEASTINSSITLDLDLLATAPTGNTLTNVSTENLFADSGAVFDSISVSGNIITTDNISDDLTLQANAAGKVLFTYGTLANNISATTLTTTNIINNTLINSDVTITDTINVEALSKFSDISINGNVITTTLPNSDLELGAAGAGEVILQENVIVQNNLSINATIDAENINIQQDVNLNQLVVLNNIKIDDNFIETFVSNSNLELRANGTGFVTLSDIDITNNVITTSANLVLQPNTEVLVNSTNSLVIPKGTTVEQWPVPQSGMIRYNSSINRFTGRVTTGNVTLGGIYSDNYLTNVQTTNNDLKFNVNSTPVATLTRNNVAQFGQVVVDDISINDNLISTNNIDLILNSQDSFVSFGNIKIKDNTIYASNDAIVDFSHTGTKSWFKFDNDQGLGLPVGDTASRPIAPEQGQTRYNTEIGLLELYNGTRWAAAIGADEGISSSEFEDMMDIYTLIFG